VLAFATRPDPVFSAFVDLAIENCLDYCREFQDSMRLRLSDDEGWVSVYPLISSHFTPETAISALTDLKMCWNATGMYMPTEFHWLVLYEALKHLSEDINDGAGWFSDPAMRVGAYRIETVNFGLLIDTFFHDTDFKMGKGFCGLVENLPPLAGELSIEKLSDVPTWSAEQTVPFASLYKPGATDYPSLE
jgi:hypothetical protein